ncbi:MAG: transporter substrate-binding domain-containing protein [bacterium]|nr:transporter substrate-binding domain-containing protein [bacterium]
MKIKTIVMSVICFLFLNSNVIAQNITLGYVDFPPYEFEENGKPSGMLVEIVKTIFEKADIPLKLKFLPFKRAYEYTKNGTIDGLFNFYKTEKRLEFFDYTDPVIENPLVFFVRKDTIIEFNTFKDLKGLKIGVMRGYTYGTDFDENTLFIKIKANSHEKSFKRLVFGRIDAYLCDKFVGRYIAGNNDYMSELKTLPTPLKVMKGHIGFTKGKHHDLINKINIILSKLLKNGSIEKIIDGSKYKN